MSIKVQVQATTNKKCNIEEKDSLNKSSLHKTVLKQDVFIDFV